jgi:glycosyltransferase involved in cell wall biosynthesis
MKRLNKPKISVLTTVYNGEKFLKETIMSVLNQTFKNFEYIFVDDGSTDQTKKIIRSFKDPRIKYFYYGKNKGYENLHNVVNFGLKECNGKYIARLDADDLCSKKRLEIQFNYLEAHPKIFMVGSSAQLINEKGKIIGKMMKKPWPSKVIKWTIGFNNPFIHSSVIFRNEGLKYPSYAEHFFFIEAILRGKKLKNLRKKLVAYRINPEGMMAIQAKKLKGKK